MEKLLKTTKLGVLFLVLMIVGMFTSTPVDVKASAGDCGYWAQADRYGRYECAGRPDDCYVLCPIIIIGE